MHTWILWELQGGNASQTEGINWMQLGNRILWGEDEENRHRKALEHKSDDLTAKSLE